MNLREVEEAFLEDLYDERKLRVELPPYGFVLYVAPVSHPKSIWHVHLASEAVAEVYTSPTISSWQISKLMEAVHIRNVSSASVRQTVKDIRVVQSQDDAKRQMIEHVIEWIGENFGKESRHTAEQCARDALDMVRDHMTFPRGVQSSLKTCNQQALEQAERARRWFPTFYAALTREVARVET